MGWSRNYHSYYFTDFADGAMWSPLGKTSSIDMLVHGKWRVIGALDPAETTLAQLLRAPGAQLGYTYDLGDMWEHRITCERIIPTSEATGAATVLGGEMRCPDEDGQPYQKDVLDLWLSADGDETEVRKLGPSTQRFPLGTPVRVWTGGSLESKTWEVGTVCRFDYTPQRPGAECVPYQVVLGTPHWLPTQKLPAYSSSKCVYVPVDRDSHIQRARAFTPTPAQALAEAVRVRTTAWNVPETPFLPSHFSVQECQQALSRALHSKASTQLGTKQHHNTIPFPAPETKNTHTPVFKHQLGQVVREDPDNQRDKSGVGRFFEVLETVNLRPDRAHDRLCACCGSPNSLRACGACKSIYYCSDTW